jgi:hypothetical protein
VEGRWLGSQGYYINENDQENEPKAAQQLFIDTPKK